MKTKLQKKIMRKRNKILKQKKQENYPLTNEDIYYNEEKITDKYNLFQ